MLTILLVTLAASPEPSFPAPRFAALPTPKFVATGCACTVCDCATCDGSCAAATRNNAGEWVVKLDGRTFTVGGAETKESAVRLAKKVAGEKAAASNVQRPQASATVKGHEHKCDKCGTVWSHADNATNASHNCPTCGRTQNVQHRAVMVPTAKAAPAPLQYFLPAATFPGNCPNGQCPNVAPARRGR